MFCLLFLLEAFSGSICQTLAGCRSFPSPTRSSPSTWPTSCSLPFSSREENSGLWGWKYWNSALIFVEKKNILAETCSTFGEDGWVYLPWICNVWKMGRYQKGSQISILFIFTLPKKLTAKAPGKNGGWKTFLPRGCWRWPIIQHRSNL